MSASPETSLAPVVLLTGGVRHELRATLVVWQREMIRFGRDRARIVSSFAQPLLFLFVLGSGLSTLVGSRSGSVDFRTFLFPGVLATSVLFTAVFSGISMVWDREFGFLREMMVAPVSNLAIVGGKCLGGATVATVQSLVIVALAGLVGVPYSPVMIGELVLLLFLMSFLMTAMGLVLAARVKSIQTAMPLVQLIITPMMFLSGSLFPLAGLPVWLSVVTRLNPLTYVVQPMRHLVLQRLDLTAAEQVRLLPAVSWFGWQVPTGVQLLTVAVVTVGLIGVAARLFRTTE